MRRSKPGKEWHPDGYGNGRGWYRPWRHPRGRVPAHAAQKLAALWTLRILLANPATDKYGEGFLEEEIAAAAGVPEASPMGRAHRKGEPPRPRAPLRKLLEDRLRQVECDLPGARDDFVRNMTVLGRVLGLRPLERDLVSLALVMNVVEGLASMFRNVGPDAFGEICRLASRALDAPERDIRAALASDGVLRRTGIVALDVVPPVRVAMEPSDGLAEVVFSGRQTERRILRQFLREAPPTKLDVASFAHVDRDLRALVRLLKGTLRRRARGVNVLVHGPPGTGKTEMVRVAAKEAGARLFEVADADDDGDAVRGDQRLAQCALAQQVLARAPRSVLVFDEVEDAFSVRWHGVMGMVRESGGMKSWTHRLIEGAPVPTFWVCNEIRQIDPATLRRFDLVVELRVPPPGVRVRMLRDALGEATVDDGLVERLASDARLTPAHVSRAVRVTKLMGAREPADATSALSHVLARNLAAQGPARAQPTVPLVCGPYDLALVNAAVDLDRVTEAIVREKHATVCLYGPPGTGKTAWAKHLSERMAVPMRAARASDLLNCFLGGTEKNIAELFAAAKDEGALLFLDEADSFLQDRAHAMRSWEVTQVNELLVQMEAFEGVFVCATNLVDSLDRASLRRFALKIELRAMRAEQRWTMLLRLVPGAEGDREVRQKLDRLDGLTPGDFAAVARQARLAGAEGDARSLVAMLERELVLRRRGATKPIGFM